MSRLGLGVLLAMGSLALPAAPAAAECGWSDSSRAVNGLIQIHASYSCSGHSGSPSRPVGDGIAPPRDSGWAAVCVRTALSVDQDPAAYCDEPVEPSEPVDEIAELTPGLVAAAFRELVLPAAELVVQPPGGRTLVNFETNFFTEQGELSRTVSVLGREVELRIRPESYDWRFGDGGSRVTTGPGSAYPDLEVTHRYLRAGRVAPSVAVTYAARFRVGDGAWRPVTGTVTVPGKPQPLRVVEARPVLVGH